MDDLLKRLARRLVPICIREWRARRIRLRVADATAKLLLLAEGRVLGGPFEGMRYVSRSHSSQLGAKILGTYECELHSIIQSFAALDPDCILDVGAAEGYYVVGLARMCERSLVIGFESSVDAQHDLRELAEFNGLASRVVIRGYCGPVELDDALRGSQKPLVIVDVDGGEVDLLDPARVEGLSRARVLVELHPFILPRVRETLITRFAPTHALRYVAARARTHRDIPTNLPLTTPEMLAAAWEARPDGQGWLWMEPSLGTNATQ